MNQSCHDFDSEINFLSELSSEISWDQHRATAEDLAVLYNRDLDFIKYADRINGCSGYLKFGVDADQGKLVLKEVWFCRVSLPCLPVAEVVKNACHDVSEY